MEETYTAFRGQRRIASGCLRDMLRETKDQVDRDGLDGLLIFSDQTGRQVDFDFRGTQEEVWARAEPAPRPAGPGRPRLGVVGREVSLLPVHWDWLDTQPNGASAALRRLVEAARKADPAGDRSRLAAAAGNRFLWAIAGDLPGFEEATRALFAGNGPVFRDLIGAWPADIRDHVERITSPCFPGS